MDALVKQWRDDTPGCARQIHFNNAGSGLMPRAVLDAMVAHLNREANFGGYESADDAEAAVADAYASVAKVLGTQSRKRQARPTWWMVARRWGRSRWTWASCGVISSRERRENFCADRGESDSCTSRIGR